MKTLPYLCFAILVASVATAQTLPQNPATPPASQAPPASDATPQRVMHFNAGTLIRAQLETAIDAKKAHVGDPVIARTTDDLNSNPPGLATKGCKITGHIVEVVAHEKDTPAKVRIVFDKMTLKNDSDMALPATIQAVGFPEASLTAVQATPLSGGSPGSYSGQKMSGPRSDAKDAKLPFNAQGAVGISNVSLAAGTEQDSILTSSKHDVKLESGMQMILRTN
jgi:hypothetical protein